MVLAPEDQSLGDNLAVLSVDEENLVTAREAGESEVFWSVGRHSENPPG